LPPDAFTLAAKKAAAKRRDSQETVEQPLFSPSIFGQQRIHDLERGETF
jgi:hypothetical protein